MTTRARPAPAAPAARTGRAREPAQATPAPVHYDVRAASLHGHRFAVQITIDRPAAVQRVSLPAWIPGSYLIREFARHLQPLQATQGRTACACVQSGLACQHGSTSHLRRTANNAHIAKTAFVAAVMG